MGPFEIQCELYAQIKRALDGTKIYRDLELERINTYEEYVQRVPVGDYEFYGRYVAELETAPNILFKDELKYYGITTGTNCVKKIPYNLAMIGCFLRFQKEIGVLALDQTDGVNPAESMQFTYGSQYVSQDTGKIPQVCLSGLIASFAAKNFKSNLLFPSISTLRIPDWAEKMAAIFEEVKDKDIRVISGVPSYLINLLEGIVDKSKINNLREIWPNLELCCYGGTPIKEYRRRLDELAGVSLKYLGIYIATEAPLGLTRTISSDFSLNTASVLYSFNRFDDPDGKALGIHELEQGGEYLVNIGTPNGFIKYAMNDVIRITKIAPEIEFQVMGRRGVAMSIATEKVPLITIDRAVSETENKLGLSIRHYFLYPSQNNNTPCYEWVFICENPNHITEEIISKTIDQELTAISPRYEDRRVTGTIREPVVKVLAPGLEKVYFKKYNQQGQLKMKSVFDSKSSFIAFVQQISPAAAEKLK